MAQKRICRPTSAKGLLSWYKRYREFQKIYRNKLTSSITTSKANYCSEAIKSGNNVGEYENVFSSQSLELTQLSNFSVNAFKLEFVMMRSATDEKWLLKLLNLVIM
jgi:hypothetical protein